MTAPTQIYVESNLGISSVTLWRIVGAGPVRFPTKEAAEAAARVLYPDESEQSRYARIFYDTWVKESEL